MITITLKFDSPEKAFAAENAGLQDVHDVHEWTMQFDTEEEERAYNLILREADVIDYDTWLRLEEAISQEKPTVA
jgi:hypothetical protein